MSRSIVSLAASIIIGSACVVTISNDASAHPSSGIPIYQPGVYRGGVYRGGVYRGASYRGGYYRGVRRAAAHQPIKHNLSIETKLKSEKPPPLRVRGRAAHFITKKAKPASIPAKTEPSATRIPLPPPSLRRQLEPKSSVAAANSNSRTIQEQVAAATAVAERMTFADLAAERDNVEPIEPSSPKKTNPMVAIVMARPEIRSVTDLAGKDVAMDEKYSASSKGVWVALVMAGGISVELSAGNTMAINRLVNGEVPAAVLAVVSEEAAEGFPNIAGFKVFRVPLMPRPSTPRP
jgi:hypothetical protein